MSTNESYAAIARRRGGKSPADVTVVRTGPDPERLRRQAADPGAAPRPPAPRRLHRRHGTAGRRRPGPPRRGTSSSTTSGRDDIAFTFMGAGDCYDELVALRDALGLQDHVEFPGRVPDETVVERPVHRGRGAVARPEEPAQRRLDDEQDHGVHGLRAAGRRVRPQGDPGVGRRRRGLRAERGRARVTPRPSSTSSTTTTRREEMGRPGAPRSRSDSPGRTSATAYVGVFDQLVGSRHAEQTRAGGAEA